MKEFLKRNFVLVLGVSLPLLLVAALLLVHGFSRLAATRPAYPVLYVSFEDYYGQHSYDFGIDDAGRLEIGFRRPKDDGAATRYRVADASLVLFDAGSETLEIFRLEAPDDPPAGQRVAIDVPEALAESTFSDRNIAPDGYRLELSSYRGGGLLRELFGTGGRSRHHRLVKDGVSFRVPDPGGGTYAHHDAFIAWLVNENE